MSDTKIARATRSATPNQVLGLVCVGVVLANLDLFIVNVALPDIARSFPGATLESLSWILNGYAIAYAALLVFFGRLAERHRRDHGFLLGIGLFTAASAACAAAWSVDALVAFRLVQAAGAALMTPASLGLLLASFPADRRGGAVRSWAAIGGLGAALGPLLGGVLVAIDWRWIFAVNVPIGAVALLIGWRRLPPVPGHAVPPPSVWAAALVTGGIGLLTYAITKVNDGVWLSLPVGGCLLLSVVALGLFLRHCLRSPNPFIDPALFRTRPFAGAVLVTAPFSAAFGGMLLSIALYQQEAWGFSGLQTGLAIAPGPVMVPLTSLLVAGRLIERFGALAVVSAGLLCFAAGVAWWALRIGPTPDVPVVMTGIIVTGIGVGLTLPTLMGVGLGALPPSSFATGSGVLNMVRQAAMAVGVAVLVAVLGSPQDPAARVAAYQNGWWLLALMTLVGLLPAWLFLRDAARPAKAWTAEATR
ncbi:MFS transporter [Methylobacterium sp. Leaf118]|uniref:MFS transporter n=1 Tax=Methylobacterium sp. Leaf118 TaxID=2876562 RepID=UPI001E2B5A3D|nr:MFS transporter [Methylobacterium sp. Leaf118]